VNKLLSALSRLSILRFAVIGALGMPVDWGVLQLMVHWGTGPYLGRMISWFCAATFTWAGNRYFTFAASRARGFIATGKEWVRFLAANAVGGLVNVGLYSVLVRFAPPPFNDLTVALICGVLLGLVFNFTLSKKIVFRSVGGADSGSVSASDQYKGPI
jgi:putative flippase GtrA